MNMNMSMSMSMAIMRMCMQLHGSPCPCPPMHMPAVGLLEQPLVELLAPLDRRRAARCAARRAFGRPAQGRTS
jgi:hypothetical protein